MEVLAKQLVEKTTAFLAPHASYTLRAGHHVEAMETQIGILKDAKADAENKIKTDDPKGKVATNEVNGWLDRVTALEAKAEAITTEYENTGCMLLGACSLDCFSNHSIGARAAKVKVDAEQELQRRDGFSEITADKPPPPVQPVPVPTLPEVSRYEIERKLGVALDFIRDGGEGSLGIWGMGGVGKTTLLLHINNALATNPSSFGIHKAVLVTASKDCTIEKLQELITKELKLQSDGESLRTNIHNYLSKRNFVLLLDDLWARLDLLKVGVPRLGIVNGFKRKLILTTRSKQVCHSMDVRLTMKVDCLSQEAARLLFREKVGGETINADAQIPMRADRVADECDGLPMALICIARAMAGKQWVSLWDKAIEDLEASKVSIVVHDKEEDPLPLLKVSYDYLQNPRVQECLLHCALWPEDFKIPKQDLIRCWMGHGLLGEFDSVGKAYAVGDETIYILKNASLLEYSEDEDKISKEGHVRLHDLIRDMALWIARECGANEKKWMVLDKPPEDGKSWLEAHKMSIMRKRIETLPSNIMCSGSNLTSLILCGCSLSLGGLGILQYLRELVYLDLSDNGEIKNFPTEICLLVKLEYLDLSCTGIRSLPDKLQNLKNLKHLLLRDTGITELPSRVLSGLERLEVLEVYFRYPFGFSITLSDILSNTIVDGLNILKGRRLKGLGISASSWSDLNLLCKMSKAMFIRTLDIRIINQSADGTPTSTHCLMPTGSWSELYDLSIDGFKTPCTEELVMEAKHLSSLTKLSVGFFEGLKDIIWKRVEQTSVIPNNIRELHITYCPKLKHVGWIAGLPLLEILSLNHCYGLKQVVVGGGEEATATEMEEEEEEHEKHAFPHALKNLRLWELPRLETICDHPANFPSLVTLVVGGCRGLKKLPFHSPASCSKLKKIECQQRWWEDLELDDDMRTALQPSVDYSVDYYRVTED